MRRSASSRRVVAAALVAACAAATVVHAVEPVGAAASAWTRPVPGGVVRPFDAPASPYGPGHRGVDLAAPEGRAVRAAGPGTVSFAGRVAGSLHVVVAHEGGLRTSYSYLREARVSRGRRVSAGDVVGIAGGSDGGHAAGVLHLGLRRGDRYLDPMLLFEVTDLTELVRLVPVDGNLPTGPWPVPSDQQLLLREFGRPSSWIARRFAIAELQQERNIGDAMLDTVSQVAGVSHDALAWSSSELVQVGAATLTLSGDIAGRLHDWSKRNVPVVTALDDLREIGARFADGVAHWRSCDPDAPAADGSGGSGHTLLAVAGVNSATGGDGATFDLDTEALGYLPDEVEWFSYADDGGSYDQEETWVDLFASAQRLGEQLREHQRAAPGREVDLIAHSQGGVVVDVFLQFVYAPADTSYPPIGTVVTLSSPHEGAPMASALDRVDDSNAGRQVLEELRARELGFPLGRSTEQLSEHSQLMASMWDRPLYEQLDVTSVGATDDVVVPADRTEVPGATSVTLVVDGLDDHSQISSDPNALKTVRAALEGREPPCVSFVDGVRGAVTPVVISRFETTLGDLAAGAGHAADRKVWRLAS